MLDLLLWQRCSPPDSPSTDPIAFSTEPYRRPARYQPRAAVLSGIPAGAKSATWERAYEDLLKISQSLRRPFTPRSPKTQAIRSIQMLMANVGTMISNHTE